MVCGFSFFSLGVRNRLAKSESVRFSSSPVLLARFFADFVVELSSNELRGVSSLALLLPRWKSFGRSTTLLLRGSVSFSFSFTEPLGDSFTAGFGDSFTVGLGESLAASLDDSASLAF